MRMIPASAPAEPLLTVTWPPGALAGTAVPDTTDTLAFELDDDAATPADITTSPAPSPDDSRP